MYILQYFNIYFNSHSCRYLYHVNSNLGSSQRRSPDRWQRGMAGGEGGKSVFFFRRDVIAVLVKARRSEHGNTQPRSQGSLLPAPWSVRRVGENPGNEVGEYRLQSPLYEHSLMAIKMIGS